MDIIAGNLINLLNSFWYTSGFVLLILMSIVDQPFFSKDSNIFINAITAIMALLLVSAENKDHVYVFFITILTQCNTIISFQEFDRTSIDYLANYFGNDIAESANNLKFRHAIASGKALKSSVPMIFEVPEIIEIDSVLDTPDVSVFPDLTGAFTY